MINLIATPTLIKVKSGPAPIIGGTVIPSCSDIRSGLYYGFKRQAPLNPDSISSPNERSQFLTTKTNHPLPSQTQKKKNLQKPNAKSPTKKCTK